MCDKVAISAAERVRTMSSPPVTSDRELESCSVKNCVQAQRQRIAAVLALCRPKSARADLTELDLDALGLHILLEPLVTQLTADAALLVAAERHRPEP